MKPSISPVPEIIDDIRDGRMVVLVDDQDRENEGDLIFAAQFATAEKINFMAKHARGLICMPITEEHARRLNLAPMTALNRSVHGTNFTVSIEAAHGVTTGISAADRAHPELPALPAVRLLLSAPRGRAHRRGRDAGGGRGRARLRGPDPGQFDGPHGLHAAGGLE